MLGKRAASSNMQRLQLSAMQNELEAKDAELEGLRNRLRSMVSDLLQVHSGGIAALILKTWKRA